VQESSRKSALELLLEERDSEYQAALAEFNTGPCPSARVGFCLFMSSGMAYTANAVYIEAKERSKDLLDISKAKLDEVDDGLRRTFQTMEEVRRLLQSKRSNADRVFVIIVRKGTRTKRR
jgi:hypothetical protein